MFTILAVIVAIGMGVSSVAPELSEVAGAPSPTDLPAVEAPIGDEGVRAPVLLEPAGSLPELLRVYIALDAFGSAVSSEPAPRLPVGLSVGV